MTSLSPALSYLSCRPNAPFAELMRLSRTSIADEMREEHWGGGDGNLARLSVIARLS